MTQPDLDAEALALVVNLAAVAGDADAVQHALRQVAERSGASTALLVCGHALRQVFADYMTPSRPGDTVELKRSA